MIYVTQENYSNLSCYKNPSIIDDEEKKIVLSNLIFHDFEVYKKFMAKFDNGIDYEYLIESRQKINIIKSNILHMQNLNRLFIFLKKNEIEALINGNKFYDDETIYELIKYFYDKENNFHERSIKESRNNYSEGLRYIFAVERYQTLLRIANSNEALIEHLIKTTNKESFYEKIDNLSEYNRNILIISSYMFPKGGGEQHAWENSLLLVELGYSVIWLSNFAKNLKVEFRIERNFQNYSAIKPEINKISEEIESIIDQYNPVSTIIFGHEFVKWKDQIERKNIRVYLYHHFWTYWIEFYPGMNIDMQSKIQNFKYKDIGIDKDTIHIFPTKRVAEICLKGNPAKKIVSKIFNPFPIEIYEKVINKNQTESHIFKVLMVNCRVSKGGRKLFEIAQELDKHIEFIIINNEQDISDKEDLVLLGDLQKLPNVTVVHEYKSSDQIFTNINLTLIPSLVEETFGRVFFESISKDVPCLVSREAVLNIGITLNNEFVLERKDNWVERITQLMADRSKLSEILKVQKSIFESFSEGKLNFVNEIQAYINSKEHTKIGIFSLWEYQGLGKLAKHYYDALDLLGYQVYVFAYLPYFEEFETGLEYTLKSNSGKRIYHSYNKREQVSSSELRNFIDANGIKILIVPEICFQVNWARLKELFDMNIKIISIPMIEIVRSDELLLHNEVDKNWMLTEIGLELFKKNGIRNTHKVAYRPLDSKPF